MSSDEKNSGSFLSRWSKRKAEARVEKATFTGAPPIKKSNIDGLIEAKMAETARPAGSLPEAANETPIPLPSIESLTKDSDFSPFMQTGVAPEMRNQAMKKLFADPHYNVMDMLDIYVDDYSKPDPIPLSMLKMMNQSRVLKLFEEEEEESEKTKEAALPAEPVETQSSTESLPVPGHKNADVNPEKKHTPPANVD
jgi:hypothetical protein